LERAVAVLAEALTLHPFRPLRAALIVTRTDAQKDSVVAKGIRAVADRLVSLGSGAPDPVVLVHQASALTNAIRAALRENPDLLLILSATATSDREDLAPAALAAAGGIIHRFGMPVDPGNLLVLGEIDAIPAIILPGCARSPALNGADWILERIAARLPVTAADIAGMGVGGLLKEMPGRPHPREKRT
jgi:molybdenum cofactor cytidylyltransferase